MTIKSAISAIGLSLCLASVASAETPKSPTAQQSRMTECNQQAKGLKGAERKAAMKSCLSSNKAAAAPAAPVAPAPAPQPAPTESKQQNRMADCNKEAKGKKGDERKAFMKSCLSGTAAAPAAAPAPAAATPAAPAATSAAPSAPATAAPAPAEKSAPATSASGKPMTAQQQRMADCAHQGKGKKGEEYKAFMSSCLKKKSN